MGRHLPSIFKQNSRCALRYHARREKPVLRDRNVEWHISLRSQFRKDYDTHLSLGLRLVIVSFSARSVDLDDCSKKGGKESLLSSLSPPLPPPLPTKTHSLGWRKHLLTDVSTLVISFLSRTQNKSYFSLPLSLSYVLFLG